LELAFDHGTLRENRLWILGVKIEIQIAVCKATPQYLCEEARVKKLGLSLLGGTFGMEDG
jgi:hypothetical protein